MGSTATTGNNVAFTLAASPIQQPPKSIGVCYARRCVRAATKSRRPTTVDRRMRSPISRDRYQSRGRARKARKRRALSRLRDPIPSRASTSERSSISRSNISIEYLDRLSCIFHGAFTLQGPPQPGQPFKFSVAESCDRIKEEFNFLQAQYHRYPSSRSIHRSNGDARVDDSRNARLRPCPNSDDYRCRLFATFPRTTSEMYLFRSTRPVPVLAQNFRWTWRLFVVPRRRSLAWRLKRPRSAPDSRARRLLSQISA